MTGTRAPQPALSSDRGARGDAVRAMMAAYSAEARTWGDYPIALPSTVLDGMRRAGIM